MTAYNCFDCNKLTKHLFQIKTINVCGRCYAYRVGHPSARRKETMFENAIDKEVVDNLEEEALDALLAMFEKAGY